MLYENIMGKFKSPKNKLPNRNQTKPNRTEPNERIGRLDELVFFSDFAMLLIFYTINIHSGKKSTYIFLQDS